MANETGNSPLPWSVMNDGRTILDKVCSTVAFCERDEDAKLICECVNGRMHLFNVVSEEQEHGFLLEEERDKLRDLVRRLLPLAESTLYLSSTTTTDTGTYRIIPTDGQGHLIATTSQAIRNLVAAAKVALGEEAVDGSP